MTLIKKKKCIEVESSLQARVSQASSISSLAVLSLGGVALLLTGCEAPLNLEGVEQELAKSVRRTDQYQAMASNDQTMVVVGSDGLVLSADRQQPVQWKRAQIAEKPSLIDLQSCPDQSFVALSTDRKIWLADAKASAWQSVELPTQENLLAVACAPDNSYWAVGSFSTILSSHDKGASWNAVSLDQDAMFTAIQFLDENTVLVAGEFGLMVRSEDAGENWQELQPVSDDFYSQGIWFRNRDEGWVAGLGGTLMHTADAGESWQVQSTGTESPLYQFKPLDDRLLVLGDHGTVLQLSDDHWIPLESPKIPVYLRDAEVVGDQVWVAGGWGALFPLSLK